MTKEKQTEQYYFDSVKRLFYPLSMSSNYGDEVFFKGMKIISEADYVALINSDGFISSDENGYPILIPKRPSEYHELIDNKWILNQEAKAKKLKKEQKQAWENIKKHRDKLSQSGVKVGDKWFHSDEISHLRLMTLKQLPALPENLQWKTMDGSFVIMTEELLSNVINARLLTEIANFKNGERHKMLMLQSENPLEYDFSSGWCEIYEEVDDE